ncbi:glycoside hydrolase family 24 protein [Enterobacter quasiroggenkampii]|uniref:glycoside hydrolase family 24 protein n=1 Tax=Enterobacter quasiroggenkampii TaxID=2497436 RepID=UPI0021D23085|nr:glycoside hydrolase family 104 protein [Enterobacter quasiroggenkampii]
MQMDICFPAKKANGDHYSTVDDIMARILQEPHGSWLAGTNAMWHGGLHITDVSAPGSVLTHETADSAVPLPFMTGGEVVAWRLNQDYLSGDYMGNALQYSSTFVLVKSTCTPDPEKPDNALDFYALYMGLAPLSAFPVHQIYQVTERGNRLRKRHHTGQERPGELVPVPDGGHLTTGDRVMVLRENTFELNGVAQRFGLARTLNGKSEMSGAAFWVSLDPVFMAPDGELRAHLPAWMQQAITQGAYDAVVTPATECVVAAGDAVGYLAEDIAPDGMQGVEKSAFVHIEVLSTDSRMADFLSNKAQVKSGPKYVHIHPESFVYSRSGDTFTQTKGQVKKDIHKIMLQDKCQLFTGKDGKRWFDIGDGAWVSGSDVDADIAQYDLMKLGFSAFEEPPTSDMTQSLHEGWIKSAFTQLAEWVRPERGIQEQQVSTWYKAILRKMDSDSSGDLSGAELYHAVHFPEMDVRDIASRMVVKHDSEWFGGSQHHRWKTFLQRTDRLYVSYVRQWFDNMEWMSQVPEFSNGEPVWHMHPVVFLDALKFSALSLEEARVRAFMRMLRVGEGTVGEAGYETLFGGQSFIRHYHKDFSNHPQISITRGNLTSSAAGAYQVMGYTWNDPKMTSIRANKGITDFTPESQDKFCVLIFKYKRKRSLDKIMSGDIVGALDILSYEWASLPPGRYGQPAKSEQEALSLYNHYLEEELAGRSDLHLDIGYISTIAESNQ